MESKQLLLNSIDIALCALVELSEDSKRDIMQKYDLLASIELGTLDKSLAEENKESLGVLLNKTLFTALVGNTQKVNLLSFSNLNKMITIAESKSNSNSGNAQKAVYNTLVGIIGAENVKTEINYDSIVNALAVFGLPNIETPDILDEDEEDELKGIDIDSLFDNLDEDETEETEEIEEETNEEETNEEEEKAKRKMIETFMEVYSGEDEGSTSPLRVAVDGIIKSFTELYESCYSGITAPDGVLTDKGLLSLDEISGSRKFVYNHADDMTSTAYLKNNRKYEQYYKAVMYTMGVVAGGAKEINRTMDLDTRKECVQTAVTTGEKVFGKPIDGRKDTTPKYVDAVNGLNSYPRFHTEFMTGYFVISRGMQEWAKENKAKCNKIKITRFSDVMKWARKRVSECLTEACLDYGLKLEDTGNDEEVTSICQIMSQSIKNIIVITAMKPSHFTLKICKGTPINANKFVSTLESYFNSTSDGSKSTSVVMKNNGASAGVIEVDVVFNKAKYEASSAFSADVIDDIIESGNVPSWSNAILGEKNTGGALTFNFKERPSIAIYGATGSGKGIMTSALLSNAIAEGCEIFYFDGKPDNGAALAKVCWDNCNGDTAVFNGLQGGSKNFQNHLEEYSHGIRDVGIRKLSEEPIPRLPDNEAWPFNKDANRAMLVEVSYTLNGFQFINDVIDMRTRSENVEYNPDGSARWAVLVIDEIQDAADKENQIRALMKTYMDLVGEQEVYETETKTDKSGNVTTQQKKSGKIKDSKNWDKDTGYLFCKKWLAWADSRCVEWSTAATKSLRQASLTMITIFQSNKWFNQSGAVTTGNTKIGKMMLAIAAKTTKIVGKGSLVTSNQWGDDTSYSWSNELEKGKWVIAKGDSGLSDDDTLYKPFKVFTTDLGAEARVDVNDRGAGANNCWKSRYDHSGNRPQGLQSYLKYMFGGLQNEIQLQVQNGQRLPSTATPEGVLSSSFDYFNKIITNNLDSQGLLHYMYNVSCITNFNGKTSEEEVKNIEKIEAENRGEQYDLDELNAGLNNNTTENEVSNNTEDEILDFGTNSSNSDNVRNAFRGERDNDFENAVVQQLEDEKRAKNLKVMPVAKLVELNLSGGVLDAYFNNLILKHATRTSFDYKDRTKSSRGLLMASIVLSNLYYCSSIGLYDLNNYRRMLINKINYNQDPENKYKFALGIIDDYASGQLNLDTPPSQQQMIGYIQRYTQQQILNPEQGNANYSNIPLKEGVGFGTNGVENGEEVINVDMPDMNGYQEFEEDIPNQTCYNEKGNGEINFEKLRMTQEIYNYTNDNFIDVVVNKYEGIERFKKVLYESRNGTAYSFKKRWDIVLKQISKMCPDKAMVTRISIAGTQINVVGKPLRLNSVVGGEYDVRIEDIVNLHALFKKFPYIQYIIIDSNIVQNVVREYGDGADGFWKMFKENKALKTVGIIPNGYGKAINFNRNTFNRTANTLNELLGVERAKVELEQFSAQRNPRLHEKAPGYLHNVYKNGTSIAGDSFKTARRMLFDDKNPKIARAFGFSILGTGAVIVGATFGLGGKVLELFTPNSRK